MRRHLLLHTVHGDGPGGSGDVQGAGGAGEEGDAQEEAAARAE